MGIFTDDLQPGQIKILKRLLGGERLELIFTEKKTTKICFEKDRKPLKKKYVIELWDSGLIKQHHSEFIITKEGADKATKTN